MPEVVGWVAQLQPATHNKHIVRAVYQRGEGLVALMPQLGVLTLFGIVLIGLGLRSIEART
jgi:ABC-type multidrug transport system permease subunit